jgi:hypothetical protein
MNSFFFFPLRLDFMSFLKLFYDYFSAAGAIPTSGPGGGIISIVGHIVRHERLFGLWRGITPVRPTLLPSSSCALRLSGGLE